VAHVCETFGLVIPASCRLSLSLLFFCVCCSFSGDTDGLLTIPVVTAVFDFHLASHADRELVFGMDANTYAVPDPGSKQVRSVGLGQRA